MENTAIPIAATPAHIAQPQQTKAIGAAALLPAPLRRRKRRPVPALPPQPGKEGAFIIRPASKWLNTPNIAQEFKMLFGSFWLQGELCILFADTNLGKSVLAVQIGQSIASGTPISNFQLQCPPVPVLYIDLELTDAQFHARYHSPKQGNYPFSKTFCRAVANPAANKMYKFASYQHYIENEIENAVLSSQAKVLIVDNITCLKYQTQAAGGAINFVQSMQAIKNRYQLSVLLLAHTPKRAAANPLSTNDLQGSKMLINFCDSAFAIGQSQTMPGMRYLKQIKQRSAGQQYGPENVCLCRPVKPRNFLHLKFEGHATEAAHLLATKRRRRQNALTQIEALLSQKFTIRQIAETLKMPSSTVFRLSKKLMSE